MGFLAEGMHPDISEETYHSDPCPEPSLNQTTAKILLERSPRHAWHQHPRLNPDFHRDENPKFDLGNVAHRILLGRGREPMIIDAPDYRTKDAQKLRAIAVNTGKLPVLEYQYEQACRMRDSAIKQLRTIGIEWLPETHPHVRSELACLWRTEHGWMRTKIDRLQQFDSIDYKTTHGEASERVLANRMIEDGWHIQAAMHELALHRFIPEWAGRFRFLFAVQEAYAPFALVVWQMPESAMTLGRDQLERAAHIWADCMRSKRWPSYNRETIGRLEVPGWALQQILAEQVR